MKRVKFRERIITVASRFFRDQKVILLILLFYFPLIFWGYGTDVDSFRVVEAGRNFIQTADYVPSRNPGYVVHEMITWALNSIGGSILSNFGTLVIALFALKSFSAICEYFKIPNKDLLVLFFAFQPFFWVNSTCTIDYVWAIGFSLIGFDMLLKERYPAAGIAFGLAVGSRLASVIIPGSILIILFLTRPKSRNKIMLTTALAAIISMAMYILPFDFTEWELRILQPSIGNAEYWTPYLRLGRFFYKNIYFLGLQAFIFLPACLFYGWRNRLHLKSYLPPLSISLLSVFGIQALFLRFPIAAEYLLLALPFMIFIFGILCLNQKKALLIFLILIISFNFVSINIARPDVPDQATSATFGLWIEPGYFVKHVELRFMLKDCKTRACFAEITNQLPPY